MLTSGCRRSGAQGPKSALALRVARSLVTLLVLSSPGPGLAAPGAFTDPAAFDAALPGGSNALDFETLAAGIDVSGQTLSASGIDVTLPGPVADVLDPGGASLSLVVVEDAVDNPAVSGTKSLGVNDPNNFNAITAGSVFDFSFPAPVVGFGLTIITPEEPSAALLDADLTLSVPGEPTANLSLDSGQSLGNFGGREYYAYFLGVVGGALFSTARLEAGAGAPTSGFFFNVDDVVVPEPGVGLGTLTGSLLLLALRRHRRSTRDRDPKRTHPCC